MPPNRAEKLHGNHNATLALVAVFFGPFLPMQILSLDRVTNNEEKTHLTLSSNLALDRVQRYNPFFRGHRHAHHNTTTRHPLPVCCCSCSVASSIPPYPHSWKHTPYIYVRFKIHPFQSRKHSQQWHLLRALVSCLGAPFSVPECTTQGNIVQTAPP